MSQVQIHRDWTSNVRRSLCPRPGILRCSGTDHINSYHRGFVLFGFHRSVWWSISLLASKSPSMVFPSITGPYCNMPAWDDRSSFRLVVQQYLAKLPASEVSSSPLKSIAASPVWGSSKVLSYVGVTDQARSCSWFWYLGGGGSLWRISWAPCIPVDGWNKALWLHCSLSLTTCPAESRQQTCWQMVGFMPAQSPTKVLSVIK